MEKSVKVLIPAVLMLALSMPAYAEDRILKPGEHTLVLKGDKYLLTPLSSAKAMLACCSAGREFESKLKLCERDKAVMLENNKPKSNPVLSKIKTVGIVSLVAGAFILGMTVK